MAAKSVVVCMIAILAALAGCVSKDSSNQPKDAAPSESAEVVPKFTDETGAIVGTVYDESELPIEGAQVGIQHMPEYEARTNIDGAFAINEVPPGEYLVHVIALGFETASIAGVKVEAGTTSEPLTFRLVALPSNEPYHATDIQRVTLTGIMWKLTPECIYEPLTDIDPTLKTCGGFRTTDCANCEWHTNVVESFTTQWQTILGEVKWQPQSGLTGKGFHYDINAPNITRGNGGSINQADEHTFREATSKSPIQLRIERPMLGERGLPTTDHDNFPKDDCTAPDTDNTGNCDWFWRIFPAACDAGICEEGFGPDYGVMVDGTAEVYFTWFVKEAAPPEYTALPVG